MYGWIKLHRKLQKKGYYKNSKFVHLWIHLLLKANHEAKEFMWNNQIVVVKEGQLITGRKQLSDETGISETTIERILKTLENEQQVGQQTTTKFRLITILNWKEYQVDGQQNGQQADNKRTASGHKQELKELEELKESFNQFWNLYDKKRGKEKAFLYWCKLTDDERAKVFENVPIYVRATEKQFRKDPERYLRNKTFNDEVIDGTIKNNTSKGSVKSRTDYRFDSAKAEQRLKQLEEQYGK